MGDIRHILREKGIILLDGSTGTELEKRGIDDPTILANTAKPYEVWKLAYEYYLAGADAVLTNSLTGSVRMLKGLGLSCDSYSLCRQAAMIAGKARREGKLVIGSVGPTGELMEPYGSLAVQEAVESFMPQIQGLIDGGVDAIVFETFLDLAEMDCAVKALEEVGEMPFICSLTYEAKKRGYASMMGDTPQKTIEFAKARGALAVGANCGVGMDEMIGIIREYRRCDKDILLWAKPNAGMPELVDGKLHYSESPDYFAHRLPALLEQDVSFIGGCCGTGPEHIGELRLRLATTPYK